MVTTILYLVLMFLLVCLAFLVVLYVLRLAVLTPAYLWGLSYGNGSDSLSSVPAAALVDNFGQVVRNIPVEGEGVGIDRHASVSLGLCSSRLRSRSAWVCSLEAVLNLRRGQVGELLRGRWTPDLPSPEYPAGLNVVLSQLKDGATLLGGGEVRGQGGGRVCYYHLGLPDGSRELLFPSAVSKLAAYALLRQRDATLVSALRLRALEWCKSEGLADDLRLIVVSSTMRLVLECTVADDSLSSVLDALGQQPPRWWQRS